MNTGMTARGVVMLAWNGQHWPGRIQDGIPTFRFRCAPPGLATRRQLRARGLCPGGQDYVAQLVWRRGRRWAALYRLDLAQPSRTPTPAQLRALDRAMAARRTCRDCGTDVGFCLPRSAGGRCWPCTQLTEQPVCTRPGDCPAKNVRRDGAPNTHQSGENPMVGTTDNARHRTVAEVHDLLLILQHRWLTADSAGGLVVDLPGLAGLVADVLTDQVRAANTTLSALVWSLSAEVAELRTQCAELTAERDAAVQESGVREQEIITLTADRDQAEARLSELDSEGGVA